MSNVSKNFNRRIDELEACMIENANLLSIPTDHLFCNNMYIRTVNLPAGALITSKIHKTEHPYCLSKGKVKVMKEDGEWEEITAPFNGITRKGNRRVVMVVEDSTWTTYHNCRGLKQTDNLLSDEDKDALVSKLEKRIVSETINSKKLKICHSLQ